MTYHASHRSLISTFALLAAATAVAALPQPARAQTPAHQTPTQAPATAGTTALAVAKYGDVDVNGTRIHYQLYGDLASGKTPLLVLHGSFMSADAMKPLIDPFALTRPVIAIDARGQGRSSGIDGALSYELMADDAAAVLAKLGVGKADVLGYSMGGTMAIALAIRHPDRNRQAGDPVGHIARRRLVSRSARRHRKADPCGLRRQPD